MSGVNKVIIIGRLGKDPDAKDLPSGNQVVNLSLATSEKWKDKQTGEQVEKAEWHRVVVFNRLAEVCSQYLVKGSMIYIEGQLRTRKWQDQEGNDRYTTEIVARSMQMLGSKSDDQQQSRAQQQSQANPSNSNGQAPAQQDGYTAENFDDNIPF